LFTYIKEYKYSKKLNAIVTKMKNVRDMDMRWDRIAGGLF